MSIPLAGEYKSTLFPIALSGHRTMSDDTSVELQKLIDQIALGGIDARRQLLERALDRLRRLAAKILGGSFPSLMNHHDVDSVIHETWIRLLVLLEHTEPQTVRDFFRLAAHKIRQVLLDMVERGRHVTIERTLSQSDSFDVSQSTTDPYQLLQWTEFHQRVEKLSGDELRVFEMHYYLEIPQVQIARILELPDRQVSRLWIKATEQLMKDLNLGDGALS